MKKLIVDMDDVLCGKGFIRMINEFLETNYQEEDANSYYINDLIPKEKFSDYRHLCAAPAVCTARSYKARTAFPSAWQKSYRAASAQ